MKLEDAQKKLEKVKKDLEGIWDEDYISSLHLIVAPTNKIERDKFIYNFNFFKNGIDIALAEIKTKKFDVYGYCYIPKEGGEVDLIINYDFAEPQNCN